MKRILQFALVAATLTYWPLMQASAPELADYPEQYTVKQGDTLWDIASVFLTKPWHWPSIWEVNSQIHNPHLIYPGDQLWLVYKAGKPQLVLTREDVRLSPSMRLSSVVEPIQSLPKVSIETFYDPSQIVSLQQLEASARVLSLSDRRLMNAEADQVMLVGELTTLTEAYGIYRPGNTLIDPKSDELLGIQMDFIANIDHLQIIDTSGIFGATLKDGRREVRIGDRVLLKKGEQPNQLTTAQQSTAVHIGQIISTASRRQFIGQHDSVTINRGTREQIKAGDVLVVSQPVTQVYDPVDQKNYQISGLETGLLMVYKAFEKASYGVIMKAQQPIRVFDNIAVAD